MPFEVSSQPQEYHKLFELNKKQATVLVVGAGFIGVEWVSWAADRLLEHAAEGARHLMVSSCHPLSKSGREILKSKGNKLRSVA